MKTILHTLLVLLLALFVWFQYLQPAITNKHTYGIVVTENCTSFVDFPSHFNFVKSTLRGNAYTRINRSVYSLENHLAINREWAGRKTCFALPFGYSPTMLWVLSPLVFFSHAIAFIIFNFLGLLSVWWQTHPLRSRFGIATLSMINPVTFACFGLGQTAVLTGAGLLYLYEQTSKAASTVRWHPLILSSAVLWALTAKPPLAITAGAILIGMRKWQPVALAAMLTVLTTIFISPLLGDGWWRDYITMLTHYDKLQAAPEHAWSLHPEFMTNLRGILSVDFSIADDVASKTSAVIWLGVLAVIAAFAPLLKISVGGLWSLGVLAYLALCPHVSGTEDLQILLLIPFCISPSNEKLGWKELLVLVVVSLACFTSPDGFKLFENNRLLLFSIKISLLVFIGLHCRIKVPVLTRHQTNSGIGIT